MHQKFFWGTSTSAYQVEGGNNNDWTLQNHDSKKTSNHYEKFEEDFDLAKNLNQNAHRFSVEWSRIEPEKNRFNEKEIEHYRKVIQALRNRNLEPFVTLWHWTLPIWIHEKGGWTNPETISAFINFTQRIGEEFKNDVQFWITLNEPELYSIRSYLKGIGPEGKYKGLINYFKALKNLIKAHREAYKTIKSINPQSQIGIASNNVYLEALPGFINNQLKKLADWWINEYFLNQIKEYEDFIGLNYYFHRRINFWFNLSPHQTDKHALISDLNWELYPEGIYYVLKNLEKYKKPIYVTENGLADKLDTKRSWFIKEIINFMEKARKEGVPVYGYFYWSLMDNFEWEKGFNPRFGLIEIDYQTFERKVRPSAYEYAKICKEKF